MTCILNAVKTSNLTKLAVVVLGPAHLTCEAHACSHSFDP